METAFGDFHDSFSPGEAFGAPAPVLLIWLGNRPTCSAGWCSAQRIKNPLIAGGNHTLIQVPPALQFEFHTPSAGTPGTAFPTMESSKTRGDACLTPACRGGGIFGIPWG